MNLIFMNSQEVVQLAVTYSNSENWEIKKKNCMLRLLIFKGFIIIVQCVRLVISYFLLF